MFRITLSQLANMYIEDQYLRPTTARNYRSIAEIAMHDMGDMTIDKFSLQHFIRWRKIVINRASETSWNTYIRHIKALMNYAAKQGLIDKSPIDNSLFVPARKRKIKIVSLDTIRKAKQLLDQPSSPLKPGWLWSIMISTFYYTAMRRSQITGLVWRDIDFEHGVINYRRDSSKTRDEWQIPLTCELANELQVLLKQTIDITGSSLPYLQTQQVFRVPLFYHRYKGKNTTPDQVTQFFRRLSAHLGEPISAHMLRHTTTTLLTDIRRPCAGSLRIAQEILGHSSITTTAVYMHPDLEQVHAALNSLPKLIGYDNR